MANNLHISYDLKNPDRDYVKIISAIKQLGGWAKINYSFWYVDSVFTAEQARNFLLKHLDVNDSLYIVDSTKNECAWHNIHPDAANHINKSWYAKAA